MTVAPTWSTASMLYGYNYTWLQTLLISTVFLFYFLHNFSLFCSFILSKRDVNPECHGRSFSFRDHRYTLSLNKKARTLHILMLCQVITKIPTPNTIHRQEGEFWENATFFAESRKNTHKCTSTAPFEIDRVRIRQFLDFCAVLFSAFYQFFYLLRYCL